MYPMQIIEQLSLVLLGEIVFAPTLVHPGGLELFEQPYRFQLEFGGELRDGHMRHGGKTPEKVKRTRVRGRS